MKWLVEKSRYLALLGIFSLLIGALLSLAWGVGKTFLAIKLIAGNLVQHDDEFNLIALFQCLDAFLVAIALIVIAVALYELFVGELNVPDWMLVTNLNELEAKFASVIVPVVAVKFVEKLLESKDAKETLFYGLAVAIVSLALTAFNYISHREKRDEEDAHPEEVSGETRAKDL